MPSVPSQYGVFVLMGIVLVFIRMIINKVSNGCQASSSKSIGWRPVPQPPCFPIVKNLFQLNLREPLTSLAEIAKGYRDVCRIQIPGASLVIVNSHRLYDELCNTKRFHKEPVGAIGEARNGVGDGLFTAHTHEENWQVAHRVLGAQYGQLVVKESFEAMHEMGQALVKQWSVFASEGTVLNPYDEFSKFSLDLIARVALDLPFNTMQQKELPQFAHDMTVFMSESGKRSLRPAFVNKYIFRGRDRAYWDAISRMKALGKEALDNRVSSGSKKDDVLAAMINNTDPVSGKRMTEDSIVNNAISILGAGYESMASMLSWTLIMLLQHPHALATLRRELTNVLGDRRPMEVADLERLPYTTACIRESLRIYPGAYAHSVKLRTDADQALGGLGDEQFLIRREDIIRVNLLAIHRDPAVYGDDADQFRPERMLEENFRKLPRNAWKPFGNGVRICIGKYFALQEGAIALTALLRAFDFKFVDDRCDCKIGDTLILVPINCTIRVEKRV